MCERPFAHTDITSREAAAQEFHFSKMNNIFQCLRGLHSPETQSQLVVF